MQIVERTSALHHNLNKLFVLLWPADIQIEYPVEGLESIKGLPETIRYFFRYQKEEELWVRFERVSGPRTVLVNNHWMKILMGEALEELDEAILPTLGRAPIEFPVQWLTPAETHELDGVTQDELKYMSNVLETLRQAIEKNLAEITKKANRFVEAARHRDHDLYMTFKMDGPDFTRFALRFDKVYPKVPEGGFFLGEGDTCHVDIQPGDTFTENVMRRLQVLEKSINRDIMRARTNGNFGPDGTKAFNKEVKTILFAASHFSKRLYPFDAAAGKEQLEAAANEILGKLNAVGGNIGLDVNSWICWQYQDDGSEPTKHTDPTLDFKTSVLDSYTESFVNNLMGYLMDLQSPYVRPYHHLVKADPNDGHAVGSIRRVN